MAEQKKTGGRRKKADVIDVGDKPAPESTEEDAEDEDKEDKDEPEEGLDADLAAAAAIDVGDDPGDVEIPEPKVKRDTSGSLAKRDPLAAYMRETRRYPLLTPEEEKALATRLVEHGDSTAARKLIEVVCRQIGSLHYASRAAEFRCRVQTPA